jgi:hypothetical protein
MPSYHDNRKKRAAESEAVHVPGPDPAAAVQPPSSAKPKPGGSPRRADAQDLSGGPGAAEVVAAGLPGNSGLARPQPKRPAAGQGGTAGQGPPTTFSGLMLSGGMRQEGGGGAGVGAAAATTPGLAPLQATAHKPRKPAAEEDNIITMILGGGGESNSCMSLDLV